MDDLDLRDLLAPPMRFHAEEMDAASSASPAIESMPALAIAYVPRQKWQDLMEPEEGLPRGTIFRQLDLSFEGRPGV